jgi:peptide/nickel transport system ATP-binding protein
MSDAVIQVKQLAVALPFQSDRTLAVDAVSFTINPGQTLCVVGESGSGKSVMAFAIIGLLAKELKIAGGEIWLGSENILQATPPRLRALRGTQIGMVFQEPMTALNPVMSCGKQVDELLREHTELDANARQAQIIAMFERVRLPEPQRIFNSFPHQLSGGQRQRIVIAMAMILKPRLLICDEPTTALDVTTQQEILSLINELQQEEQSAVLFITHDMGIVQDIADFVMVMHQGKVVEQGSCQQVLEQPRESYTKMLLAAVPSMTPPAPRQVANTAPVLRALQVHKTYESTSLLGTTRTTQALVDASLALRANQTIGVVGESGSGKSTLARCIVRLIDPTRGAIHWGDPAVERLSERQLRPLRSHIQVVFQDPNRSLNPRLKIIDSMIEGAVNFGLSAAQARQLAEELIVKVQLPVDSLQRYPNQFSGGQRQRLAIARALACKPKVLVADEAVSALDVSVQAQILVLLRTIQAELGLGLLFITHDLRVAAQLCDEIIVMHQGKIVEHGLTQQVYSNPVQPYTRALLSAAPGKKV